jgi:hypothetical protein
MAEGKTTRSRRRRPSATADELNRLLKARDALDSDKAERERREN